MDSDAKLSLLERDLIVERASKVTIDEVGAKEAPDPSRPSKAQDKKRLDDSPELPSSP